MMSPIRFSLQASLAHSYPAHFLSLMRHRHKQRIVGVFPLYKTISFVRWINWSRVRPNKPVIKMDLNPWCGTILNYFLIIKGFIDWSVNISVRNNSFFVDVPLITPWNSARWCVDCQDYCGEQLEKQETKDAQKYDSQFLVTLFF